jgi:hypothetical protein
MQLLLTASKKAAEKKKALGEDGQNGPGGK